ncbi:DUF5047 domain-containing protein [Streptomyces sp. NPDC005907]|uniref:DUF5047 domain-containing protein n=1 Tax=Streptomyces sp. NPDC005907 TaxID=3154571 RepID=UPI0033C261F0
MYAISDNFRQALTASHRIVTKVDAYYDGVLTKADIPVSDGSVSVDRGSKIRRSLSLTVADLSYLPWDATDPLAVYGQTLVVSRGIRFANGDEMVPLGTFRINEPAADVHMGPVTLTGVTAEATIADDVFMVPTSTKGYGNCVQAIEFLIRQTIPGAPIVNLTSDNRNPVCPVATWDAGGDRWDAVVQVATAMRAEIYVDAIGRFVLVDLPNPLTTPVSWDIAEGEGGTLISASRQMSRTAVYNAVVVSGENAAAETAPVVGVAYDNDPASPTKWGGPYGRVPKNYTSALVVTAGDAQSLANYMIADLTAPNIQTSISSIPNPALEAGDCIRVTYAGRKELFIAQSFSVPLTAEGDFPITLRGGKEEPA